MSRDIKSCMADSEAKDQRLRGENVRLNLLYKTLFISNAIRKCSSEGSTSFIEESQEWLLTVDRG